MNLFSRSKPKTTLAESYGITLINEQDLRSIQSINGLSATDFGYMIQYHSQNKVIGIQNIANLPKNERIAIIDEITNSLDKELETGNYSEQSSNAKYNLINLKEILETLSSYLNDLQDDA